MIFDSASVVFPKLDVRSAFCGLAESARTSRWNDCRSDFAATKGKRWYAVWSMASVVRISEFRTTAASRNLLTRRNPAKFGSLSAEDSCRTGEPRLPLPYADKLILQALENCSANLAAA